MYVSIAKVKALAQSMTENAQPKATDELIRDLIERTSRMFDRECGVDDEYFESALHPIWESGHVYVVGDLVTPTTPNSHVYRVTTAGTSGNSEPSWLTGSGSTVVSGTATFTEYGADVVATSRVFYGDGSSHLKLDPYVTGTLSSTISLPSGYTTPDFVERNGYLIRTASDHVVRIDTRYFWWDIGVPITLTAKWGFESTPADVQSAIIEWVINLWRETDTASLKLTNLDGFALREPIPPRVKQIAKFWTTKTGAAFV